ncbi:MAG: cyclopropane-fatty-acyl-phospholipid synthase family protein [Hyphomicrobiales bacterium]
MELNITQDTILVTRDNAKSVCRKLPIIARAAIKMLIDLKYGAVTIKWPNGAVTRIEGQLPGSDATIELLSFDLATRVFKNGDVGVGESYMDEQWKSPDVTAVLKLFCENNHLMIARQRKFITGLLLRFIHWRNSNTKTGSKRNISAHYDLGNSFYKLWLDPSMTYSSALYREKDMDIASAQREKYANLAELIGIREKDNVLEIGCGWGGFAEYAAKEIGCKVTALTISQEQHDFAKKRIFEAGLNEKVDIVFRDYREEKGHYDRIASIEMFEAVGEKYWPVYFDTLRDRLNTRGTAGLQVITIKDNLFEKYRASTDFIQRYIFPGGMLPTPQILSKLGSHRGLQLTGEHVFGHDYADTLVEWRKSFHEAWPEVEKLGFDHRFKRMWEFYMYYCEAGFRSENINVRQVAFAKA